MTISNNSQEKSPSGALNNPYKFAARLVLHRLKWDLNYKSWISRRRIKAQLNSHIGKSAVILCNGPSLLKSDFSSLKDVFTIGLNKINLLFDKSAFRPNCIVSVNRFVIEQNHEFFNSTDIPLYLSHKATEWIKFRKNVNFFHTTTRRYFSRDISLSLDEGHTVTYVALQLAFHLGFTNVTLVGCDHNFITKGPANKIMTMKGVDPNHFDPNYFTGEKWQLPDLFESEVSYSMASNAYIEDNRHLYNSTEGGNLEILQRISLLDFLNK